MLSSRTLQRAATLTGADREWYFKTVTGRPRQRGVPIETWALIHAQIQGQSTTNCQVPPFLQLYGYDIRAACVDT